MDIAVIGSNMVDLTTYIERMPIDGETVEAPDFVMGCGGKGANQAVAAARLGSDVLMVTSIGSDMFGSHTLRNFEANGIDTTFVTRVEGTSGVAPIFVDPQSQNSIIIVKGANNALTPDDVSRAASVIATCALIVVQLEIPYDTVYAAIELGNQLGVPVLLNPAPATTALDLAYVARCEYCVPNEIELATLTGRATTSLDDVKKAAHVLLDCGCRNVLVTLGSRGVYWSNGDQEAKIDGLPVDAVDTSGAGDAFIGCFSHSIVHGLSMTSALQKATAYAAFSVTRRGTQMSYASAAEFRAWESAGNTTYSE